MSNPRDNPGESDVAGMRWARQLGHTGWTEECESSQCPESSFWSPVLFDEAVQCRPYFVNMVDDHWCDVGLNGMPHSSVGTPAFAVGGHNEVSFSSLTPDEQEQFVISDKAEWEAIKSTNAARVLSL